MARPISDIMASSNIQFGKSKVSELLKAMEKKGVVSIEGNGRGTKYRISIGPRIKWYQMKQEIIHLLSSEGLKTIHSEADDVVLLVI